MRLRHAPETTRRVTSNSTLRPSCKLCKDGVQVVVGSFRSEYGWGFGSTSQPPEGLTSAELPFDQRLAGSTSTPERVTSSLFRREYEYTRTADLKPRTLNL